MSEMPSETAFVEQHDNTKLAVWLFIGGEVVFFATLILTLVFTRLSHPGDFQKFVSHLTIPLIGVNTFVLILSSFLVVRGLEAIRKGNQTGLRNNIIGVIVLGALFLGGQAYEWTSLFRERIDVKSTVGTPFFTVTGIHGTHVLIGIIWAVYILVLAIRGAYSDRQHQGVELFGLYWHFVDIVWIVLFTVIYLI
jgi:heme/copper-type cytochrome/quinol oxidase subunit 3